MSNKNIFDAIKFCSEQNWIKIQSMYKEETQKYFLCEQYLKYRSTNHIVASAMFNRQYFLFFFSFFSFFFLLRTLHSKPSMLANELGSQTKPQDQREIVMWGYERIDMRFFFCFLFWLKKFVGLQINLVCASVHPVIQDSVNRAELKLTDIADLVQGDWVVLAQQLHISISDINHIKNDYKTVGDQALAMLHFWVEKNGDKATGWWKHLLDLFEIACPVQKLCSLSLFIKLYPLWLGRPAMWSFQ